MSEAQTATRPQAKGPRLEVPTSKFVISLGSKGSRRNWTATLPVDVSEFPPNITGFIVETGLTYMIRQASNAADRESEARSSAKPGTPSEGRWIGEAGTPYTEAEHEARALELAKERVEMFRRGETGKQVNVMSAVERRAFDNVVAAIKARLAREGKRADADAIADLARNVLADAKTGPRFRTEAQAQIEAEQAKAAQLADALGDFNL